MNNSTISVLGWTDHRSDSIICSRHDLILLFPSSLYYSSPFYMVLHIHIYTLRITIHTSSPMLCLAKSKSVNAHLSTHIWSSLRRHIRQSIFVLALAAAVSPITHDACGNDEASDWDPVFFLPHHHPTPLQFCCPFTFAWAVSCLCRIHKCHYMPCPKLSTSTVFHKVSVFLRWLCPFPHILFLCFYSAASFLSALFVQRLPL